MIILSDDCADVDTSTTTFRRRARAVGIVNDDAWPYGANVDHVSRARMVAWAEANRLRYSPNGRCLHWLARGRCVVEECLGGALNRHYFMDHVTGWNRERRPAVLVAQPYDLSRGDLTELTQAAAEHDLEVAVCGTGWYGHGTTFVAFLRPDDSA